MARKDAVLMTGTGVIALTLISLAFHLKSGTPLPDVKTPHWDGSRPPSSRLEMAQLAYQTDSGVDAPQALKLFSPAIFTVGILRADSILIPFASFDGASWFNPWPEPYGVGISSVDEIPRRLSEIPAGWWGGKEPALDWELLAPTAGRQVITATGSREFQAHCTTNIALTTNFQSGVKGERLQRYAGIAATVENLLTPVAKLDKDSRDFQTISRLLPELFARLEPGVWASTVSTRVEPLLTGSLPAPTLNHVYSGRLLDGTELFTVDAHRELRRRVQGGQRPEMATRVVGWFTRRGTAPFVPLDVRGSQSINDQGGDAVFIPFASLKVEGRSFWLGNLSGYESERYIVVEVGRGIPNVLMTADAGGC